MPIAAWLAAMMGPLTARILMSLGFSVVTIVGVTATLDAIKGQFIASMNTLPAVGLQLAMLAGAGQAMGIILGAMATRVMLWQIQKGTRILGVGT